MQLIGSHFIGFIMAPILLLGGLFGHTSNAPQAAPTKVVCTMEAKRCPDGSYVGRRGPTCQFTTCPIATSTPQAAERGTLEVTITSGTK